MAVDNNTPINQAIEILNIAIDKADKALPSLEVVSISQPYKILRLDPNGKLPTSITGNAVTADLALNSNKVANCSVGTSANNILKLDTSGLVPATNLPTIPTTNLPSIPPNKLPLASGSSPGVVKIGSGINLDPLDGTISVSLAIDNDKSLANNGYVIFSNGLIIQWGTKSNSGTGFYGVIFPIAFPNAIFGVYTTYNRGSGAGDYRACCNVSLTGASIATDGCNTYWMALGI